MTLFELNSCHLWESRCNGVSEWVGGYVFEFVCVVGGGVWGGIIERSKA